MMFEKMVIGKPPSELCVLTDKIQRIMDDETLDKVRGILEKRKDDPVMDERDDAQWKRLQKRKN